jgi:uncharacterized SAM-binding protein YcdF (DUF218 family)
MALGDSRRWRRIRRWVVSVCVLPMAIVIAGVPVYARPQIDPLRQADAILVLGGPHHSRYPFGIDLGGKGWAPTVVISKTNDPSETWLTNYCTTPHPPLNVRCFVPDPPTTKGEARELRNLAATYGWRTVIVVTFRPHISRARFILEQCFDGSLIMVASPERLSVRRWAFEYVYQTAGYMRAVLESGC